MSLRHSIGCAREISAFVFRHLSLLLLGASALLGFPFLRVCIVAICFQGSAMRSTLHSATTASNILPFGSPSLSAGF